MADALESPTSPRPSPPRRGGEGVARVPADPSDIPQGDGVERGLPRWAEPDARLARGDRPIGTWLLLFPGWWGIALASPRWPDPLLLLLFAIGAVAMRGAGCTLNDIADREYDGKVARTRLRPLPSGRLSVRQAVVFMAVQLAIGAAVLFSLKPLCWAGLAGAGWKLYWQAAHVNVDDAADCLAKFRSNRVPGWLLLIGIVAGHFA